MKKKNEKTLLAGVAALALFAGTGLTAAQQINQSGKAGVQTSQSAKGSSQSGEHAQGTNLGTQSSGGKGMTAQGGQGAQQPSAAHNGKAESRLNQSAQEGTKAKKDLNRSAERSGADNLNRSAERANTGENFERNGRAAAAQEQRHGRTGRMNTAEQRQNGIPKGLQGNAGRPMQGQETASSRTRTGGGNIQLSQDQRSRIRDSVIDSRRAPRVGHVDFDVSVGTRVPHSVRFARVPQTLVRIRPMWRGYRYFVYQDQIVIVDPRDLRIVAVVPV